MSKIYEALLQAERDRAELERSKRAGANGNEADPLLSVLVLDRPAPHTPDQAAPPEEPLATSEEEQSTSDATSTEVLPADPGTPAHAAAQTPPEPIPQPVIFLPATPTAEILAADLLRSLKPGEAVPAVLSVWKPVFEKLPALENRGSQVEQFRSLRSRLFEFRDLNELKTLLVSSGRPGEGKSFVAANLAISFARHKNSRVLLIDGDMRRSSLHLLFGCENKPGLADYLGGKAPLDAVLQRGRPERDGASLPHGLASLTFLPAGDGGDRAADLSGNERFPELLKALAPMFDWIIVDSSPVNLVTDGANMARHCDGVLLIARGGVTKYATAQRALTELKASKVLGMVINAVENPPVSEGYYGYDSYDSPTQ